MKNLWRNVLIGMLVLVLAAFFSAPQATAKPASKVLKIGVVAPFTGGAAPWGLAMKHVYEMWSDEVNARGGLLVGGERYRVKIIYEDNKYDAATSRTCAEKLVYKDKVKMVEGPMGGANVLACYPVFRQAKVLGLGCGYSPKILGSDKPYQFRNLPTNTEFMLPYYRWLKENHPEVKTCSMLEPNNEPGWAGAADAKPALKKVGIKLLSLDYYEKGTKEYYPLLTKIISKNPDYIDLGTSNAGDTAIMIKQARQLGHKGLMGEHVNNDIGIMMGIVGKKVLEGFLTFGSPLNPPFAGPDLLKFEKAYTARYGEWNLNAATYWYSPRALAQGLKRAGTIEDVDKIMRALETVEFPDQLLGSGTIKYGGEKKYGIKRQLLVPITINSVADGEAVTLVILKPEF